MKYIALLFIFFTVQVLSLQQDYFWREYTGNIPNDAIVGGNDINMNNIYIGQAYIKNFGLFVVQIYPGIKQVHAPIVGVKSVDQFIKILCGSQENFYWLPANNTNLHLNLIDKHAVIGGHNDGLGYINIGRVSYQDEIKIGKVNSFDIENSKFYFVHKGTERVTNSYEILIYEYKSVNVVVKTPVESN